MITTEERYKFLVAEAKRWVGVIEQSGDNKGQCVEMFQKACDGKAVSESWCMAFVQFCLKNVDDVSVKVFGAKGAHNLFVSEHCLTVWDKSPKSCQTNTPLVGSIAIWQMGSTMSGHTGIVVNAFGDGTFETIEGNTGPGAGVVREGDGVYLKKRSVKPAGNMKLLGFLLPY